MTDEKLKRPVLHKQPGKSEGDDLDELSILVPSRKDLADSGLEPVGKASTKVTPGRRYRRSRVQREKDLHIIAELYLKGWYQYEIAEYLTEHRDYSLSQAQISYDVNDLRQRWLDSSLVALDEHRAEQLAKIDRLEQEYWKAWERSLQDEESERVETELNRTKVVNTARDSTGDPRFLQGIQWCISRRIEIFGLDAPKRLDVRKDVRNVSLDLNLEEMSADELEQLERILSKAIPDSGESREGEAGTDPVYDVDVSPVPG